jgi:hypothetical protein
MPAAFAVANSPLTSNGSIEVTGAGTTAEYVRGDGSLATFPALTGFVPYTGATQNVDLGEFGVDAGFVQLDTTPTNTPTTQGTIFWDVDDETVDVVLNGYIMKIGEDQFYPVKNQTGSSIAKGTAVRFAGTVGASGRLLIAPFIADGSVSSSFFMGVTAEAIADGEDGKVLYFGRIRGINTNAFNEGDVLYASTTVAGGFQTAVPVAPNNIVQVAAVINKSINQGVIFIRPSFGSNINQDEGVKIVSPTTGQLLQLQAGGLWENKTKAQILGGTSSQFVKGDGSLDSTAYGTGSVTSVAALTLGTTGTDLTSTVANGTTTPVITLNVPTASAANRGALSAADWTTFNNKENAITAGTTAQYYRGDKTFQTLNTAAVPELTNLYYTEARVSANTDVAANTAARHNAVTLGTANGLSLSTQELSLGLASSSTNGALSSTDWTTFNNKENAITAGTTAQYFRGDKTFQTLNTSVVPELTNLYYTDGRARGALSFVAGSGAYNSSTGVITIPTNNNQITNGAGYITSAALGDYLPLTGGTLTGALGGTSASFSSSVTATSFIPSGSTIPTNGMYLPSANTIAFSTNTTERIHITSFGDVGIGTNNPTSKLHINGGSATTFMQLTGNSRNMYIGQSLLGLDITQEANADMVFATNATYRMRINAGGNVWIGNFGTDTGDKLRVVGTTFTDNIKTLAPTGTNNEFWKLGRALLATSADPEDRWIRVQLGTKIYDILAIDRGDA